MAVDLDEAFRSAVAAFYEKSNFFENYEKTTGEKVKYGKEFFDRQEKHVRKSVRKSQKNSEVDNGTD
jgi:hypothetical protein